MDVETLLTTLHPLERAIVPHLLKGKDQNDLARASGMQDVEVLRAMMWLDNKEVIKTRAVTDEKISLGKNGRLYMTKQLPELRFLKAVSVKPLAMNEAAPS